jgi:hypothetical protein
MPAFTDHLTEANRDLWAAMAGHPFVVVEAEAFYLRGAAYDGVLDGLTALYAAERAYLDTRFELAFWEMRWSNQAWPG